MKRFWIILTLPALAALWAATHPVDAERAAVERAVLDYVDALYDVDPTKIQRSVHPELAKRGFFRSDPEAAYQEGLMTYQDLHALAGEWNRNGRVDPRKAPKQVSILDVLDQTATAKLVAHWGVDYMHLARYDGQWKIVHVLWQSAPSTGQ